MLEFTDNAASIHKVIPLNKLFDDEIIKLYEIEEVVWHMSIKPGIRKVTQYIDENIRYEEIEVLTVKVNSIPDIGGYSALLRQIHKLIRYQCVVFFEYKDKFKISAWNFTDSVSITNHNIMQSPYISSWIRIPQVSQKTQKCYDDVMELLFNGEGCIKDLYQKICIAISYCFPSFIGSRTHLQRIVYDLTGIKNDPLIAEVESAKRYEVKNAKAKYQKREYGNSYKYVYEYEDIWAAFMKDERTKKVIEKRRYCNIDDLILTIDLKYEESQY